MHRRRTRARPALMAGGVLASATALIASTLLPTAIALSSEAGGAGLALPMLEGTVGAPDTSVDVRKVTAAAAPTLAQVAAASALLTYAGAGSRVTWDHRFGTRARFAAKVATSPGRPQGPPSTWRARSWPSTGPPSGSTVRRSPRWR